MKTFAALSLAAVLTAGSVASASAFVHPWIEMGSAAAQRIEAGAKPTHHDRCHGQMSGTAHESCGTATGGPVGGLF